MSKSLMKESWYPGVVWTNGKQMSPFWCHLYFFGVRMTHRSESSWEIFRKFASLQAFMWPVFLHFSVLLQPVISTLQTKQKHQEDQCAVLSMCHKTVEENWCQMWPGGTKSLNSLLVHKCLFQCLKNSVGVIINVRNAHLLMKSLFVFLSLNLSNQLMLWLLKNFDTM